MGEKIWTPYQSPGRGGAHSGGFSKVGDRQTRSFRDLAGDPTTVGSGRVAWSITVEVLQTSHIRSIGT
jgi:hypothetical protein